MVALNKETQALDEAIVKAVKTGRNTLSGIKVRLGMAEDFGLRSATERKISKRLDALRRAGVLACKGTTWEAR